MLFTARTPDWQIRTELLLTRVRALSWHSTVKYGDGEEYSRTEEQLRKILVKGTPLPCCKLRETFGGQFGCCLPAYHVGEHSCTVVDVRRGSTKRWGHVVQLFCVKKVPKDETQNFEGKGIGRRLNEKLESWLSS